MTPEKIQKIWELNLPRLSISKTNIQVEGMIESVALFDRFMDNFIPTHFKRDICHIDYDKETATRTDKVNP